MSEAKVTPSLCFSFNTIDAASIYVLLHMYLSSYIKSMLFEGHSVTLRVSTRVTSLFSQLLFLSYFSLSSVVFLRQLLNYTTTFFPALLITFHLSFSSLSSLKPHHRSSFRLILVMPVFLFFSSSPLAYPSLGQFSSFPPADSLTGSEVIAIVCARLGSELWEQDMGYPAHHKSLILANISISVKPARASAHITVW